MALFHAHTSYVSRSTGSSVCAHVAYISASKILEDRTGNLYDYRNKKKEVLHSALFVPEGLKYLDSPEKVWNYVDVFEDRLAQERYGKHKDPVLRAKSLEAKERFLKTASTGFKMECALPVELRSLEKIELSERLARALFLSRNLVVHYAIHDSEENPHVHFVSSFRPVVGGDFGKRKIYYRSSDIKNLRAHYASITNAYAKELGYDFSIDHRSLKEQGIDREPTRHRGWYASFKMGKDSRIYQENQEIYDANQSLFMKDSEELLKQVIADKTVFSKDDLLQGLEKLVGEDRDAFEILRQRLEGVKASDIKEKIERFGAFCDTALGCHMLFSQIKKGPKSKALQQDYQELRTSRTLLAKEIQENAGAYKWLMAKVGLSFETLALMTRSDIAFCDAFMPFKTENLPKELRAGDMLASLTKVYGERLDQKLVDLFNLTFIGQGVRKEELYMGEGDLKMQQTLQDLKEQLTAKTQGDSFWNKLWSRPPKRFIEGAIREQEREEGYKLSARQREAIDYLMGKQRFLSLEGKAGTGKTTVLRTVSAAYKKSGYRIMGTSFQGAAVGELSRSLGLHAEGCYTLDKLKKTWDRGDTQKNKRGVKLAPYEITAKTVIIVDEAGMAPSRLLNPLLKRAHAKGAKVILVGDPQQLGAIERGAYGRLLMEGSFVLEDIRRQTHAGDRQASLSLAKGQVREALAHYAPHTIVRETCFAAKLNLAGDVVHAIKEEMYGVSRGDVSPTQRSHPSVLNVMILAFRNQDVKDLNISIQNGLYTQGCLGRESIFLFRCFQGLSASDKEQLRRIIQDSKDLSYSTLEAYCKTHAGEDLAVLEKVLHPLCVHPGDKILFTRNHRFAVPGPTEKSFTVYNGNAGVVRAYDPYENLLTIEREEGDVVEIPLNQYTHFDLGYALTINRSQGKTAPKTYVYLGNTNQAPLSQNVVYVALTRHKESCFLYTSKDYLGNQDLADKMRPGDSLTYADVVGERGSKEDPNPHLTTMQSLYAVATEAKHVWGTMQKEVHSGKWDLKDHPDLARFQSLKAQRKVFAEKVLADILVYQPYLSAVSYTQKTLQRWAGHTKHSPTAQDLQMAAYREVAAQASRLWQEISRSGGSKADHPAYKDFLTLQHKRNAYAYQLTAFGMPKAFSPQKGEGPSLMLLQKKEVQRLQRHTRQYIEAQGHPPMVSPQQKQNLETFYNRIQSAIDVEGFVTKALGPGKVSGESLRFGSKGALSVHRKTGIWTNFKEGSSGSLLGSPTKSGLLAQSDSYKHLSFPETLAFAKSFVQDPELVQGMDRLLKGQMLSKSLRVLLEREGGERCAHKRLQGCSQMIKAESSQKIVLAKRYTAQSKPIYGTVAETYLQKRGITIPPHDPVHQELRYREVLQKRVGSWKKIPSLTSLIRDEKNQIQGIQTTLLTPEGTKDTTQEVPKRIQGVVAGGFVLVQRDVRKTNTVILAEGVETALSLKGAGLRGEIRAVLGINNFKSQKGLDGKEVWIAADNDTHKQNPTLKKTLNVAAAIHKAQIIMPDRPGQDFNDVLQTEGRSAVRAAFGVLEDSLLKTIERCASLDPTFDKEKAREEALQNKGKLPGLEKRYATALTHHMQAAYKDFASQKQKAPGIPELLAIARKEVAFVQHHQQAHPEQMQNNAVIGQLPSLSKDVFKSFETHQSMAERLGVLDILSLESTLRKPHGIAIATESLWKSCQEKVVHSTETGREVLKESGAIKVGEHIFKQESAYLNHQMQHYGAYMPEEYKNSLQKEVAEMKRQEKLERAESYEWSIRR